MLRSMYSGVSGMRGFQTKLDVIGNNIANVSTSGYKKSRITFQEMMNQTIRSGQAGAEDGSSGGVNPLQVGLGTKVGTIDSIHTQGFLQPTDNPLDLAIEGGGMFQVNDGEQNYYTRAGNFYLDGAGHIVNVDGYYLVNNEGEFPIQIPDDARDLSINQQGGITITNEEGNTVLVATIGLKVFPNPGGLIKQGGNSYSMSANSGNPPMTAPGDHDLGAGLIRSGALEMSNVDLAEEFAEMIIAQRGFQSNTKIITTSDEILQELVNLKR